MENLLHLTVGDSVHGLAILLDAAVKGLAVLAVAAGVTLVLRRRSAALRHLVWTVSVLGLFCIPVLSVTLPEWRVPLLPSWATVPALVSPVTPAMVKTPFVRPPSESQPSVTVLSSDPSPRPEGDVPASVNLPPRTELLTTTTLVGAPVMLSSVSAPSWLSWIIPGWLSGVLLMALPLLIGTVGIWLTRRKAQTVADPQWLDLLDRLRRQLGIKRPVLLLRSSQSIIPLTCGLWRPMILLPQEADSWTAEGRTMVLLHELAHIRRGDCLTQLLARLARVLYWFNPLVWLAGRMLRIERERACDDLVLAAGHKPADYASHLLEIVRSLQTMRCPSLGAVAMAKRSQFEGRLLAILDPRLRRGQLTRLAILVVALLMVAVTVPLACMKATTTDTKSAAATAAAALSVDAGWPFPAQVSQNVTKLIESQSFSFMTPEKMREIQDEFKVLISNHTPKDLSDERKQAILAALRQYAAADLDITADRVQNNYLYLKDQIKTLQWEIYMAVNLAPLDQEAQQRLVEQRRWMRQVVLGLPADGPLKPEEVVKKLERKFDDPLCTVFDRPMTEGQFSSFRYTTESKLKDAAVFRHVHNTDGSYTDVPPHNFLSSIVESMAVSALNYQYSLPKGLNAFPLFDQDQVVSWGWRNGVIHLSFASNEGTKGWSPALAAGNVKSGGKAAEPTAKETFEAKMERLLKLPQTPHVIEEPKLPDFKLPGVIVGWYFIPIEQPDSSEFYYLPDQDLFYIHYHSGLSLKDSFYGPFKGKPWELLGKPDLLRWRIDANGDRVAIKVPLAERLKLSEAPHTTDQKKLPDLFDEKGLRPGVIEGQNPQDPLMDFYYVPDQNVYYVQNDPAGSSTKTFYGPYHGKPWEEIQGLMDSMKIRKLDASGQWVEMGPFGNIQWVPAWSGKVKTEDLVLAQLTLYLDEAGHLVPQAPTKLRIEEAAEISKLASFFPEFGLGLTSGWASGWVAGAEIAFTSRNGKVVHVVVSGNLSTWSESYGDWAVRGDLAAFLKSLRAAKDAGPKAGNVSSGEKPAAVRAQDLVSQLKKLNGISEIVEEPVSSSQAAEAPWSTPVNGLQARLVLKKARFKNGKPFVDVSLELKNVADLGRHVKLALKTDRRLKFRIVDAGGVELPQDKVGNERTSDLPPFDLTITHPRILVVDLSLQGQHEPGQASDWAGWIILGVFKSIQINPYDPKDYYLEATLEVSEAKPDQNEAGGLWHGRLELPKVKIPSKPEPFDAMILGKRIDELGAKICEKGHSSFSPEVRELSRIDDERVIPWYAKVMATNNNYELKYTVLGRLGCFNSAAALEAIKKGMTTQWDDGVRYAASLALLRSPHPDAKRLLLSMWKDPSPAVRKNVLQACGKMDSAESLEILKKMTADPNEMVRGEAVWIFKLRTEAASAGVAPANVPSGAKPATATDQRPWSESVEGVQVWLRAEKTSWPAAEEVKLLADVRNRGSGEPQVSRKNLARLKVDGQWYHWKGSSSAGLDLRPEFLLPGKEWTDNKFNLSDPIWLSEKDGATLALDPGRHQIQVGFGVKPFDKNDAKWETAASNAVEIEILLAEDKPAAPLAPANLKSGEKPAGAAFDKADWGVAAEGVQVRLRAEKTQWQVGEEIKLLADVRNQGIRNLIVWQTEMKAEVEVDGHWYSWAEDIEAKSSAFPPGRQYNNIAFSLSKKGAFRIPDLSLDSGKHKVRVAFIAEPKDEIVKENPPQPILAVSNSVEIEILQPAAPPVLANVNSGEKQVAGTTSSQPSDASWSEPVNGLQARLVLKRAEVMNGTPIIATSLELKNVAAAGNPMKLAWAGRQIKFRVVDAAGKDLPPPEAIPYDGGGMQPGELTLPHAGTLQFDISCHGMGIVGNQAALIDLGPGPRQCWIIPRDGKDYYLQATLEIPKAKFDYDETGWLWHGRLELPKAQIPLKSEPLDPVTLGRRIDELGARMLGQDYGDSEKAVRELSLIDDVRVIPWYVKAMAGGTRSNLKLAALDRLCCFQSDAALEGLKMGMATRGCDIGNCSDADGMAGNIHHAAACALSRSPHPDAKRLLLSLWNDPYYWVRIDVVQACGEMDTAESLELLKKMTADHDVTVRTEAQRILKLRTEAKFAAPPSPGKIPGGEKPAGNEGAAPAAGK